MFNETALKVMVQTDPYSYTNGKLYQNLHV